MRILVYLVSKYALESGWCYLRLRNFACLGPKRIPAAFRFGFLRLVVGRVAALLIRETPIPAWGDGAFAAALALAGWIAWSGLDEWMRGGVVPGRGLLIAPNRASLQWRLAAMTLSGTADVLALLLGLRLDEIWA